MPPEKPEPPKQPYVFHVTNREVMKVTVWDTSEEKAKEKINKRRYADLELAFDTEIIDTEYGIDSVAS